MMIRADVVVVGAGPAGATAAGELARRGVKVIVLDDTDGVFREARLHNVTVRTMELARIWGIEDDLINCGWPLDHPLDIVFMTSVLGHEIGRIPWAPIRDTPVRPESPAFTMRVPQAWLNPILHDFARNSGADLRWHHRFESYVEDADGVTVEATDSSRGDATALTIRAKFLIGADGPRSTVQRAAGITRTGSSIHGHSAEVVFDSPEFASLLRGREGGRYVFLTPQGMSLTINPFDGKDLFRLSFFAEAESVTPEMMSSALAEATGRPVEFAVQGAAAPWVNRETEVSSYRAGRVMLVGDAAHTWPPLGGYGANTGILDSFDIAWKLAAVLQGWGGEGLLAAYDMERRSHAERMRKIAVGILKDWFEVDKLFEGRAELLYDDTGEGSAFRERLGRNLERMLAREFNSFGGALGYRYEGSPLIVPDGTPEPADSDLDYIPVARPGHLVPHVWLTDGSAVLDHLGSGYVLFDGGGPEDVKAAFRGAARELALPLEIVQDPATREPFDSALVLVRPDGHVAWRWTGDPVDAREILTIVAGR